MLGETSIRLILPKELKNHLDRAAKKYNLTRLGLIRLALVEWLKQKEMMEIYTKEDKKRAKEERIKGLERIQKMQDSLLIRKKERRN